MASLNAFQWFEETGVGLIKTVDKVESKADEWVKNIQRTFKKGNLILLGQFSICLTILYITPWHRMTELLE
jgi:hypothetical protein